MGMRAMDGIVYPNDWSRLDGIGRGRAGDGLVELFCYQGEQRKEGRARIASTRALIAKHTLSGLRSATHCTWMRVPGRYIAVWEINVFTLLYNLA